MINYAASLNIKDNPNSQNDIEKENANKEVNDNRVNNINNLCQSLDIQFREVLGK